MAAERKEAKFEKEEAEKYTRLKEELVSVLMAIIVLLNNYRNQLSISYYL